MEVALDDDDTDDDGDGPAGPPAGAHPLLSPQDRVWRHPSEIAADKRIERHVLRRQARRAVWRGLAAAVTVVTMIAFTASLLVGEIGSPRSESGRDETLAVSVDRNAATSLAEPVAAIELHTSAGRVVASGTVYRGRFLLTTARLLKGVASISVITESGPLDAKVAGIDVHTDLAVLETDRRAASAPQRRESLLRVGMAVMAATGEEPSARRPATVTSIDQRELIPGGPALYGLARIDLPPEPRMTGAALLDGSGRLVGLLNAMTFDRSSSGDPTTVVLPARAARNVADAIIDVGTPRHASLGVTITDLPSDGSVAGPAGAVVTDVRPGSPAAELGVRPGDRIVSVGGRDTRDVGTVMAALLDFRPGDRTTIGTFADGATTERPVRLGESLDDE